MAVIAVSAISPRAALAQAVGALLVSAALCVLGFLGVQALTGTETHRPALQWSGAELRAEAANTRVIGNSRVFAALPSSGYALAGVALKPVSAADYPFARVQLSGRSAGMDAALIWRSDTRPTALNKYPLPWSIGETTVLDLSAVRQWNGNILNLGIALGGQTGGPLHIQALELLPYSGLTRLHALWSDATAFEGWRAYRINFAYGGTAANWPLGTLIIAAWSILAALLLLIWQGTPSQRWDGRPFLLVLCCGWGVLDARELIDLTRQAAQTIREYAGEMPAEKRAGELNGPLFQFITAVKAHLPTTPQQIVLLPDPTDRSRAGLGRASYYLRPHNVYAADGAPLCEGRLQSGDYVLLLGASPQGYYDATAHQFTFGSCPTYVAEQRLVSPMGQLLQLHLDTASAATRTKK